MRRSGLVAAGILVAMMARADDGWRTEPPITYVLDYGREHLGYPEYIDKVASGPPHLLHLGKDVPMSHNWGPIQCLGGENQAGGKGECIRRLSPDEVEQRFAGLTAMVRSLHQAGCRWVLPYICSMTIGGSHRTRTGFWEFYDHWNEYLRFGLPPRPELDPEFWVQRDPDGTMKSTYGVKPDKDPFYPPYEPNMRYAVCVNNPGWRTWIDEVCRQVATVGYDGAFIDNGATQRCYCRFCQEKYQDFLRQRYSPTELRELFGVEPGQPVPLTPPPGRGEALTLGWVETQRFFVESIHQHQLAMRRAGEQVSDHFLLFPNGGRPHYITGAFCDSDWVMFELSLGEYGTNPGLVRSRLVEDIHLKVYNDHAFEYKYVQAVRKRVGAICLTRGGYPSTSPALDLNENCARLGMAEAAAFGSRAGFLIRPDWQRFGPVLNEYRRFFEAHEAHYRGLVPYAQVGLLACADQDIYDNSHHLEAVKSLTTALLEGHVLFDYVVEDRCTPHVLRDFRLVVVPQLQYASASQLQALAEYVAGGGIVLLVGKVPAQDLQLRPLRGEVPERLAALSASGAEQSWADGHGRWVWLPELPDMGLLERLNQVVGANLSVAASSLSGAVRFNAFVRPENGEVILHVLNYDTPLGALVQPVLDKSDVTIALPLPEGRRATIATAWSPDRDAPLQLPLHMNSGRAVFTLPNLHIYELVQIAPD